MPRDPERRADPVKWLARWAEEPDFEQSRFLDLIAQHSDGRRLPVDVRVRAGRIGDAPRYFITVRDNTARRQELASLREANLRAARILMVAEDAIVVIDASQNIVDFNIAAETMFGYAADEVVGRPLALLIPPWARALHPAQVNGFAGAVHKSFPTRAAAEAFVKGLDVKAAATSRSPGRRQGSTAGHTPKRRRTLSTAPNEEADDAGAFVVRFDGGARCVGWWRGGRGGLFERKRPDSCTRLDTHTASLDASAPCSQG